MTFKKIFYEKKRKQKEINTHKIFFHFQKEDILYKKKLYFQLTNKIISID